MGRLPRIAPILPTTLALVVIGSLAAPAATLAKGKSTIAPPGNSGVNQYVEDVPTVRGGKPSSSIVIPAHGGGGSGGPSRPGGSAVPVTVTRKLDHSGPAGKSAVVLAQSTAPVVRRKRPPTRTRAVQAPAAAVLRSLAGSAGGGGTGAVLPVFLIGTLVVLSAIGILRRRGTP